MTINNCSLMSLDIRKLGSKLPEDIDALSRYWRSLNLDGRLVYLFSLEANDFEGFFNDLRASLSSHSLCCTATAGRGKRKQEPGSKLPVQPMLSIPYPRDLTRCSPFFPVPYVRRKDQAKVLPYLNDWPLAKNSWGTLTYKGPTLTTAHEDLLVALLALVQSPGKRSEGEDGGMEAHIYTGSLRELLVATGCKQPNGQEYDDAFDQLADLSGAVVSVLNSKGRRMAFSSLIVGGSREDEKFQVTVNQEFLRAYREGDISFQSLLLRQNIRSLVGKALYRFVAGQSGVWKGSLSVLCGALNLTCDLYARKKLRRAIDELIKLKVLLKGSGLSGSVVLLVPSSRR